MITTLESMPGLLSEQPADLSVVYTGGVLDMIHEGHIALLRTARDLGDITVVGVMADSRVTALKKPGRPVQSLNTRMIVLDAIRYVDYVFPLPTEAGDYQTIGHLIVATFHPAVFLTGSPGYLESQEEFTASGTQIVVAPRYEGTSTTEILERHYAALGNE